jgi:hypothetical protein
VLVDVDTTYLAGAPRSTNFFNGRLLSGEDLTQEREATRALLERLGRACGEGIAYGLEVKTVAPRGETRPCLSVAAGLAINRLGQTLELRSDVTVALLPVPGSAAAKAGGSAKAGAATRPRTGDFGSCRAPTGSYLATRGVYLFLMRPAPGREGSAPASGLGNIDSPCTADSLVDGVVFHFERLEEPELPASVLADEARLRNRVAHLCFGSGDPKRDSWVRDPFRERSEKWGLLDEIRGGKLQDCDVPLALFYWKEAEGQQPSHVAFVDLWSVRRRPARVAFGGPLAPAVADRRQVEGEAMILQFQEELSEMSDAEKARLTAALKFAWLPPIGALPLANAGLPGCSEITFFAGLKLRPGPLARIEGAVMHELMSQAPVYPPVQVTGDPATQELLWRYQVRENLLGREGGAQEFGIFASGQIPYRGNAVYDLGRWTYASYAEI